MQDQDRKNVIVKVARMYYEDQIRQADIAKDLNLSKPMVSRMLNEARENGVVEIIIHYPWRNNSELEARLIKTFNLKDARVLDVEEPGDKEIMRGVGVMGARLLEKNLKDGMILALSRGTGVYSVVQELKSQPQLNIRTTQLQGALGDKLGDGADLSHVLSRLYSGEFHMMHAPLVLGSRSVTEALLNQPIISETLELSKKADIAVVGIGSIDPEVSSLLKHAVVDRSVLDDLAKNGIVGDIAGRHFDANGDVLDIEFNHRLVCMKLRDLRKIPIIIGIASGIPKIPAIRAALKANLVNMLATDSIVARRLLNGD